MPGGHWAASLLFKFIQKEECHRAIAAAIDSSVIIIHIEGYRSSIIRAYSSSTIKIARGFMRGNWPQDTDRERPPRFNIRWSSKPAVIQTDKCQDQQHTPTLKSHQDIPWGTPRLEMRLSQRKRGSSEPPGGLAVKRDRKYGDKDDGIESAPGIGPLRCGDVRVCE